jgi:hypothetical protein
VRIKPKLDSDQNLEVRKMMAAPTLHRGQILAKKFPNLRAEVPEEAGTRTYDLWEIREMLASSFIFPGEIGKNHGLKAISCLRALKGRGSVVTRTEMAKVGWCHPEEEVRRVLVDLIAEPRSIKKKTRIELLELIARHDPRSPSKNGSTN